MSENGEQRAEIERANGPDVSGCALHPRPDPNCEPCLAKWGLTLTTTNRAQLLHPNALRGRFRPGQSGNPAGPKPRQSMEQIVEKLLDEEVTVQAGEGPAERVSRREALARLVLAEAIRPNPKKWAVELLLDKLWPNPPAAVNVNSSGSLTIVFDDQDRREMEAIRDE